MEGLRQYIISVVTAAMICGILSGLVQSSGAKNLVKLLCGIFMTFTVLSPIVRVDIDALLDFSDSFTLEAEAAAALGENMANEFTADIIKTDTEAYILDKAAGLNAQIEAEVTVGENRVPVSVCLSGEISPYARLRLENIMESELGIAKENQLWTG